MAEANGHMPRDLPGWTYRGCLLGLIGLVIYLAVEVRQDVHSIKNDLTTAGQKNTHAAWRLDAHDRTLEDHGRRIWNVERAQPGSMVGPR